MSYAISVLAILCAVMWVCLSLPTPAERQRAVDASCPASQPVIRYPEELGGPHPAVCNPTGQVWRTLREERGDECM